MAGTYNIVGDRAVEAGTTWTRTITVKDDGVARDLTGYTIRMQVREKPSSTATYLDLDNDQLGGIVITDAPNGIFKITIDDDEGNLSPVSHHHYQAELEDPSGVVTRLLTGLFEVSEELVR